MNHRQAGSSSSPSLVQFPSYSQITTMAIELAPLTLPASASVSRFDPNFGREVKGVNPGSLTPEQFKEIEAALYTVCL